MNKVPSLWQKLGLEGKSIEKKADYWKTQKAISWQVCEAMYPEKVVYSKPSFNERYPELSQMYKEPSRDTEILERKAKTEKEIRSECREICPDPIPRQTILSSLGEQGLEQAYNELYRKNWFGIDFGKKKKIGMLRNLLNCKNLDEAVRNWKIGEKIDKSLLPEDEKLEAYVKTYFSRGRPAVFISGRAWAMAAA